MSSVDYPGDVSRTLNILFKGVRALQNIILGNVLVIDHTNPYHKFV